MKKYYLLPSFWRWTDAHTSPHLSRRSVSFGPLISPLITCNGEMLTWCRCYYGIDSGMTSICVLQLACSHDGTALQVALDTSILFQEDCRVAVNREQSVQHTLWPSVGVSISYVIASSPGLIFLHMQWNRWTDAQKWPGIYCRVVVCMCQTIHRKISCKTTQLRDMENTHNKKMRSH